MRGTHVLYALLLVVSMTMDLAYGSPAPPEPQHLTRNRTRSGHTHKEADYSDNGLTSPAVGKEAEKFRRKMIRAGINNELPLSDIVAKAGKMISQHDNPAPAGRFASAYLKEILSKQDYKEYRRQRKIATNENSVNRYMTGTGGPRGVAKLKERMKGISEFEDTLAGIGLSFEMDPREFAYKLRTDRNRGLDYRTLTTNLWSTLVWKENNEGFDPRWRQAFNDTREDLRHGKADGAHSRSKNSVKYGRQRANTDEEDSMPASSDRHYSRAGRVVSDNDLQGDSVVRLRQRRPQREASPRPVIHGWNGLQRHRSRTDRVGKAPVLQFGYGEGYGNAGQAEYEQMTQAFQDWPTSSQSGWDRSRESSHHPYSSASSHDDWGDNSYSAQQYSGQAASSSESEPPIVPVDPVTGRSRVSSERRLKPITKPPGALY
ncbi:hypothetical protein CBS101457_002804 [Exobasidium rhododendri]|nr:hypothetical protein CBS101457_002804 [Exobasidium rhododendri]